MARTSLPTSLGAHLQNCSNIITLPSIALDENVMRTKSVCALLTLILVRCVVHNYYCSLSWFPTTLTSCPLILTTKHCVTKQHTPSPASSTPAIEQSCQLPFKLGRVFPHICQDAISNASSLLMSACLFSTWMTRSNLPRAGENKWWNEIQNTFLPIKYVSLEISRFSYCSSWFL